jgi:DNA repair ATPase RecN
MENETETEISLDAELASLRKAVDEHEVRLENIRGFMKTNIDFNEQQLKISQRHMERLDELEQKYNVLVKAVAELAVKEESRGP